MSSKTTPEVDGLNPTAETMAKNRLDAAVKDFSQVASAGGPAVTFQAQTLLTSVQLDALASLVMEAGLIKKEDFWDRTAAGLEGAAQSLRQQIFLSGSHLMPGKKS